MRCYVLKQKKTGKYYIGTGPSGLRYSSDIQKALLFDTKNEAKDACDTTDEIPIPVEVVIAEKKK